MERLHVGSKSCHVTVTWIWRGCRLCVCNGQDRFYFVLREVLLQPIAAQATVSIGIHSKASRVALAFRNGETSWFLPKPRNRLEHTSPRIYIILLWGWLPWQWARVGEICALLLANVHLHHQMPGTRALVLSMSGTIYPPLSKHTSSTAPFKFAFRTHLYSSGLWMPCLCAYVWAVV